VNSNINNIGILIGYDDGNFASLMTYSTGDDSHPYSIVAEDLNNDKKLDLVVANYGTDNIGVFIGCGNSTFINQTTYSTFTSRPLHIAIGEFNNHNRLDIIVASRFSNNIGVLLSYGNGSFEDRKEYFSDLGLFPMSVAIGDFNKGNQSDIVVVNHSGNNIYVSLGQSNGSFSDPILCTSGNDLDPMSLTIGDFNNDNELDICVADSGGTIIIYHGNGDGTFGHKITYATGYDSAPNSVVTGYFNTDNQLDIVIANYDSNSIVIFFGDGHNPFPGQTTFPAGSDLHPIVLVAADLNNDNY
jgi:hypothetical protein